jgi:GDP-L-fucose synthase
MKVLVTGGNGFVGKNLQKIRPDWVYISRKDADLTNFSELCNVFDKVKPDAIVHLASSVGGLFYNMSNNIEILEGNEIVNINIMKACRMYNVTRGIFILSTCIYPDRLCTINDYVMTENDIHNGLPHHSNIGYATSKRVLDILCDLHNKIHGTKFLRLVPSNLYGPYDHFDSEKSHVVPALVTRIHNAKSTVTIHGAPDTRRQFLYVKDFCNVISNCMDSINSIDTANSIRNVVPKSENTIQQLVECIITSTNPQLQYTWTRKHSDIGQVKKTCSYNVDYDYTSLEKGIQETVEFYKELVASPLLVLNSISDK